MTEFQKMFGVLYQEIRPCDSFTILCELYEFFGEFMQLTLNCECTHRSFPSVLSIDY